MIISGLAYGIDYEAHKLSLLNNLSTTAIYGGGIDKVYPREHYNLSLDILENGGLLTEYPIGTKVESYHFVARNRIIAGMSDVVISVEAPLKSGSILTVKYANDYNRECFAVPGDVFEKNSEGCNRMIKDNLARIITSAVDLIEEMNWNTKDKKVKQEELIKVLPILSEEEKLIVDSIIKKGNSRVHIDIIQDETNLPMQKVSSILLKLEINEVIDSTPGKFFTVKK